MMSRAVLEPACLRRGDARALADVMIARLEKEADEASIDRWVALAETASAWLTPTTVRSTSYQKLWRLRFFTQTLELPTLNLIEQLIGSLRCDFVDVGAHVGYFSIAAAAAGARSVLAIEMHEPNWRLLQANVPSATCLRAAAGTEEGTAQYFVGKGHSNHSLAVRGDTTEQRDTTQLVTLDGLRNGALNAPYLVKIDVQGWEAEVLRGHNDGLASGAPIIIFEAERNDGGHGFDDVYDHAFALLKSHHYRTFAIEGSRLVEIDGAGDPFVASLPTSSNILAVAAERFGTFEAALFDRRPT